MFKIYMMAVFFVLYVGFIVFMLACIWKVYTKAGKPGWSAFVPIYNIVVLLEIVGKPTWWIILMLIPIVNIFVGISVQHRLSLSFGKDAGFTVGLIFLPFIFFPILAFSDATYKGALAN